MRPLFGDSTIITCSKLPLYRNRRDLYYLFDITEFRYKGSYINCLEVLGENIHFDISGYFVISECDIEGVDCMYIALSPLDSRTQCLIHRGGWDIPPGKASRC